NGVYRSFPESKRKPAEIDGKNQLQQSCKYKIRNRCPQNRQDSRTIIKRAVMENSCHHSQQHTKQRTYNQRLRAQLDRRAEAVHQDFGYRCIGKLERCTQVTYQQPSHVFRILDWDRIIQAVLSFQHFHLFKGKISCVIQGTAWQSFHQEKSCCRYDEHSDCHIADAAQDISQHLSSPFLVV